MTCCVYTSSNASAPVIHFDTAGECEDGCKGEVCVYVVMCIYAFFPCLCIGMATVVVPLT